MKALHWIVGPWRVISNRAATGTVGSRKFQLPLWIASCSVRGSPRPAVTLTLTWPRTFIMLHFATHTHDVPAFSSPAFSTPAIWSHIFQSCVFQSRVFSVPVTITTRVGGRRLSPRLDFYVTARHWSRVHSRPTELNWLGMSVLREYAIAAYSAYGIFAFFAYFSKVRISHIFPHKWAFLTTILIFLCFYLNKYSICENCASHKNVWSTSTLTLIVIIKFLPNCLQKPAQFNLPAEFS